MFNTGEATARDVQIVKTRDDNNAEIELILDPDTVYKALNKIKIDKAPEPDDMHPMILEECARSVSIPVSQTFSQSLATGSIPTPWKLANVSPIYKKEVKQIQFTTDQSHSLLWHAE